MADFCGFQPFRRWRRRSERVGAEGFHYFHIFFRDGGKKRDRITSERENPLRGNLGKRHQEHHDPQGSHAHPHRGTET